MKKISFTMPQGLADLRDAWVGDGAEHPQPQPEQKQPRAGPMKRFTIDVPEELHKRVKSECAKLGLKMNEVLREMLETRFGEKS
jgi:hypothetical protein